MGCGIDFLFPFFALFRHPGLGVSTGARTVHPWVVETPSTFWVGYFFFLLKSLWKYLGAEGIENFLSSAGVRRGRALGIMLMGISTRGHDVLNLLLGREQASHAILLVQTQPGLASLGQSLTTQVVDQLTHDDQDESDGVHPMNLVVEDLDTDADTPKVHGEQRDVEEGGRRQSEHEWSQTVEQGETEGEASEVAAHLSVPDRSVVVAAFEDGALHAVNDAAVQRQLTQNLIHGLLADKVLLGGVGKAVERGAQESKEVSLQLVAARDVSPIGTGDVVRGDQDTHSTDADHDAGNLGDMVANLKEQERDNDHYHNGPEVNQLSAQHGRVLIRQNDEEVTLNITKCENDIFPAVGVDHTEPALESITVDRVRSEDTSQNDVVEQGLERRNGPAFFPKQGSESACGSVGDRKQLSTSGEENSKVSVAIATENMPDLELNEQNIPEIRTREPR